jgi:Fe-S oxidoreductase
VKAIADEITELVIEFGGAISSEHGDGRARSPYLERVYGPKIMQAFRELKRAFDPKNLMNPGNIVNSPPIIENLRYGPEYKTWEPDTLLDFSKQGGFAASVEMCNGAGVCRKTLEGTMCPSYMVTKDEEHSTRGRANALRSILSGNVPTSDFTGQRLANGLPERNRVFGRVAELAKIGSRFAPFSNIIMGLKVTRRYLEERFGIDIRRKLPKFANRSFTSWFRSRRRPRQAPRGIVVLFNDTFSTYYTPEIGRAAVELLEAAGYRIEIVNKKCCGRPLISKGMLAEAKEHAAWNVAQLTPWVERGVPIVGLEPSCLLTLRDEWVDLLRNDEAKKVAQSSFLFEEFLLRERAKGLSLAFKEESRRALLHVHCHQKAMVGSAPTVAVLQWANFEVIETDSGCCGMAGSFGFEKEHYDISINLGKRRLTPAVLAQPFNAEIVAPGMSCRHQIEDLTRRRARHPAEVLREALKPGLVRR